MSRPACHCRSCPVTTACHGLTHSESRGQGLPDASTPLAGGRGFKAARARRGGRDGGRGLWRARYLPALCIPPRCEAAARDSLMGGGWFGLGTRAAVEGTPGRCLARRCARGKAPCSSRARAVVLQGPPLWLSVVHAQAAAVCGGGVVCRRLLHTRMHGRTHAHTHTLTHSHIHTRTQERHRAGGRAGRGRRRGGAHGRVEPGPVVSGDRGGWGWTHSESWGGEFEVSSFSRSRIPAAIE